MATYTRYFNLAKPSLSDPVDIEVLNENFDTIDEALHNAGSDRQEAIVKGSLTLTRTWSGNGPYTQVVSIQGVTENSKIDLQPDATALVRLKTDGVSALWAENDNGTVTVYALGSTPTTALTIQYTRTEIQS